MGDKIEDSFLRPLKMVRLQKQAFVPMNLK